jgi:hypothetical protein
VLLLAAAAAALPVCLAGGLLRHAGTDFAAGLFGALGIDFMVAMLHTTGAQFLSDMMNAAGPATAAGTFKMAGPDFASQLLKSLGVKYNVQVRGGSQATSELSAAIVQTHIDDVGLHQAALSLCMHHYRCTDTSQPSAEVRY